MNDAAEILKQFLDILADDIRANVKSSSGNTAKQIDSEVKMVGTGEFKHLRGELYGPPYVWTLEDGRGPTRPGAKRGDPTLQQSILGWVYEQGFRYPIQSQNGKKILNADSLSWAIAIKIHAEGNKLFRSGGKSGVITNAVTPSRIDSFLGGFGDEILKLYAPKIIKVLNI